MNKISVAESQLAGLALFTDAETFLVDLSEDHESVITGGANSVSNSGLTPAQRRRRRLQRLRRRRRLRRLRRQGSNSASNS